MKKALRSAASVVAFTLSSVVIAATVPAGTQIHFATCTLPGVEKGCVVASSGGNTYNVTGAKPGIGPHQWLQGTGTVVSKMSYCQQGQIIENFVPDQQQHMVGCVDLNNKKPRR